MSITNDALAPFSELFNINQNEIDSLERLIVLKSQRASLLKRFNSLPKETGGGPLSDYTVISERCETVIGLDIRAGDTLRGQSFWYNHTNSYVEYRAEDDNRIWLVPPFVLTVIKASRGYDGIVTRCFTLPSALPPSS